MVGGSITVDQTVLNFKGKRRESLLGTASAGPIADSYDAPEWKKFVADYKANFKDGFPARRSSPTSTTFNMKAALDGLEAVTVISPPATPSTARRSRTSTPDAHGVVTLDENARPSAPRSSPRWRRAPTASTTTRS